MEVVNASLERVWSALQDVRDPEIPAISITELGLVRDIDHRGGELVITLTPTFSGCPALETIRENVARRLAELGYPQARVHFELDPPWSTDDISAEGRAKLHAFGLAPPQVHGGDLEIVVLEDRACPYCGSRDTVMKNSFGSTPCRTIHYCNVCRQPFEGFKPL